MRGESSCNSPSFTFLPVLNCKVASKPGISGLYVEVYRTLNHEKKKKRKREFCSLDYFAKPQLFHCKA